jgi:hypothetical protein
VFRAEGIHGLFAGTAVLLFAAVFLLPGTCSLFDVSTGRRFALGAVCAAVSVPFILAAAAGTPGSIKAVPLAASCLALECCFWPVIFKRNRMLFSRGVFFTVLAPLLIPVCGIDSFWGESVFAVSPFGYLHAVSAGFSGVLLFFPARFIFGVLCLLPPRREGAQ